MTFYALDKIRPDLPADGGCYWVAPDARLIGRVKVEKRVSIWFGATIRGDNEPVTIGEGSNIQDSSVLHTDPGFPLVIGRNCTVGHRAIVHGCTIGDGALIGMGATVLNGARIGSNCLLGACALVPEGKEIPDGTLAVGIPAKVIRELDEEEILANARTARSYQENIARYINSLEAVGC